MRISIKTLVTSPITKVFVLGTLLSFQSHFTRAHDLHLVEGASSSKPSNAVQRSNSNANDALASATYLANEGIMVESGGVKILFDPFFHNDYGSYQLVPEKILSAIKQNEAPYHDIDIVFISHAHGDHFAAQDMLDYLVTFDSVSLVAPQQAIDEMAKLANFEKAKLSLSARIRAISLAYRDAPISFNIDNVNIDAVRIPHAGWPGRADVSNIVYRVTLPLAEASSTYIHMGDADPNDSHFRPLAEFWQQQKTDLAFPPYWFFLSHEGNYVLDYRINTQRSVGVHVPIKIPQTLLNSGKAYFSTPGEVLKVSPP
ncbi:MBL fold metallo-hydrolase [Glaciecola sp. MH2013]|uniref:MBL fold metallo-hydrolase n=1 Tax=Glaciecola sp. MH2013 TaxID=2785524 RepID=UPI0018A06FBE|nr:MBL fold metallo-hydrolase [Glaciecola sp. MH2013]MBF7074154.1 MBL fold metallo-hydrolase [Glaciecola sp. MH2013]